MSLGLQVHSMDGHQLKRENYSLGPYHPEYTQSHLLLEVELVWAWLVLGWQRELQLDNHD